MIINTKEDITMTIHLQPISFQQPSLISDSRHSSGLSFWDTTGARVEKQD